MLKLRLAKVAPGKMDAGWSAAQTSKLEERKFGRVGIARPGMRIRRA